MSESHSEQVLSRELRGSAPRGRSNPVSSAVSWLVAARRCSTITDQARYCVKFKKGETVIYPQHGACVVQGTKKMEFFGEKQEYLILKTVIN